MFSGCTSLTTVNIEFPANLHLASSCYEKMFEDCTSLINCPELPCTSLATDCYYYMFSGCTSLNTLPALPATSLPDNCYSGMFYGCSSI